MFSRAYADYDSCIKTSINKLGCRLLPSEADLHETDITNVYTRPPYGCTKTDSGEDYSTAQYTHLKAWTALYMDMCN